VLASGHRRVLVALLLLFGVLGLAQAWSDSPTYDENYHVAAGVSALTRHQLRIGPEHPPLPRVLAAAPALLAHPIVPDGRSWDDGDGEVFPAEFFRAQDAAGRLRSVFFLARLVPLLMAAATGLVLHQLGRSLYGEVAGLASAMVWLTTPLVLGLGHVNSVDMAFTLTVALSCLALIRHLRQPTVPAAGLVGIALGGMLVTRFSAFTLCFLMVAVIVCHRPSRWARCAGEAAFAVVVAVVVVWAVYRGLSPFPEFRRIAPAPGVEQASAPVRLITALPWPVEFETGISDLDRANFVGPDRTPAFILGHEWVGHRWWYWPAGLVVKLPASVLAMLVAGPVAVLLIRRSRREALLAVLLPLVTVAVSTALEARQIGVRYLLPAIALGIVLGAGAVAAVATRPRARWLLLPPLVIQAIAMSEAHPYSLSWTAPPFRPGFMVATDSNLDWGQDLYRLRDWARGRPAYVAYFGGPGSAPGWQAARPLPFPPAVRGDVVVSASNITGQARTLYGWLRAYCPVEIIGRTILVYRFSEPPELTEARVTPRPRCKGSVSVRQ
jgi:hypothetical protein